jgi:hypothetical protein
MLTLQVNTAGFADAIRALRVSESEKAKMVLDAAGIDTVAFLRSLTEEMRPPVRSSEGPRPAHPGHWADVTGNLAGAYDARVVPTPGGWALVLSNAMEYAGTLEQRDGYFVLRGVTDPGGPLEQELRRAIRAIAPTWRVVSG